VARICFHSDDSYRSIQSGSGFTFVTAGIALDGIKSEIERELLKAEERSGKGDKDWHETTDVAVRLNYMERLLDLSPLVGRVFYGAYPSLQTGEYWGARLDVLSAAIGRYTARGRCHHEMAHEGFTGANRDKLRLELRGRGFRRVTVESAALVTSPQIRCADALSGYIRGQLYDVGTLSQQVLPDIPDWFVDLRT